MSRDRGSASVWSLAVGLAVVTFALAMAGVGSAVAARHRAQSAADLGALAGAVQAVSGASVACDRARLVVESNEATLVECRLSGLDVVVTAAVALPGALSQFGAARASARAGPVR